MNGGRPPIALLGSGEFEPWTEPVDQWLLERATGDGRVLILPAASAPEGDEVFDRWANMGLDHYRGQDVHAEVVPIKTREDAESPMHVARLQGASVAFFSGGNPAYLASILAGTAFWAAIQAGMSRGLAYAGCSAGVASLGEVAPDSSATSFRGEDLWRPGLRMFPRVYFGPHWDALDRFVPGLRDLIVASVPPGSRLLAIDEHTAVVGDGEAWTVIGSGAAHLMEAGEWIEARAGQSLSARLMEMEPADE